MHFVNADLMADELFPLDRGTGVEAAAELLMLAEINRLAVQGHSFALEEHSGVPQLFEVHRPLAT